MRHPLLKEKPALFHLSRSLKFWLYRRYLAVTANGKGGMAVDAMVLRVSHSVAIKTCITFNGHEYDCLLAAPGTGTMSGILRSCHLLLLLADWSEETCCDQCFTNYGP